LKNISFLILPFLSKAGAKVQTFFGLAKLFLMEREKSKIEN